MVDSAMLPLLLLLHVFAFRVTAQNVHNVTVGVVGSFYDPLTVSAGMGDVVNFIFGGDIHSVTQSSFENPCTPLPGGFDSGFLGRGDGLSGPTEMWSLTITNASMPLWYFCGSNRPVSHCESGMVGAINPPSQDAYTSFRASAKAVTSTSAFSPSLATKGIGANAAAPITITDTFSLASTPGSQTSVPAITSSISASTSTPPPAPSNERGAVIGGAVGAVIGVLILFCLGVFLCFRIRKQRRQSIGSSFFAYNPQSPPPQQQSFFSSTTSPPHTAVSTINPMSTNHSPNYVTAFDVDRESNAMMQKQPLLQATSTKSVLSGHTKDPSMMSNMALQPQRYLPHMDSTGQLSSQNSTSQGLGAIYSTKSTNQEQAPFGITAPAPVARPIESSSHSEPSTSEGVDLKALAKEVAAVLREEKSREVSGSERLNINQELNDPISPADSLQSAPPKYHTVNGD